MLWKAQDKMKMHEKRNGVILSYVVLVLDTLLTLVYTPFLLNTLGDSQYGLYQLMGSMVNYFAVMDLGLGSTTTRYIVKYRTEKDKKSEQNFLFLVLIVYAVIGAIILAVGGFVSFFINNIFSSLSSSEVEQARVLFMLLIVNLVVTLFDHAFTGVLNACESFTFEKSLKIARLLIRMGLIFLLLSFIPNAVVIVLIDLGLSITLLLIKVFVSIKKLEVKPRFYAWDKPLFKEVFGFTFAVFLQTIINQFNNNVDKTVLGIYSTTAIVGIYSIAMQIFSAFSGISTSIQSVYFPQISRKVFEGKSDDEVTVALVEPSRMQFLFLAAVSGGFFFYGKQFVHLWCGKDEAWLVAMIVMVSGFVELCQNCTTSVLKAKNLLRGRTIINLATAIGNFIITVLLVPKYGMVGAACGTAFAFIVGYIVCNNLYYHFVVHINVPMFFTMLLHRLLFASLLGIALGSLFRFVFTGDGWFSLICQLVCFSCVYMLSVFFLGLNEKEKRFVKGFINKIPWKDKNKV